MMVGVMMSWYLMREYHFFFLDQHSQIKSTKITHCADDVSALEFAQGLKAPVDIEIWQGARLVTRLNADGDNVATARRA